MNKVLTNVVDNYGKKFNKLVLEGLAKFYLEKATEFVDELIKNNVNNLKPHIGLSYMGLRRLDPVKEWELDVNNNTVDLATNYLYKIELLFELNGEPFSRYLSLPFVEENGSVMYLSDTPYVVTPVLTEYSINPTGTEVFIRLLKDKLIFKRLDKNFFKNGMVTRLSVIHAQTYKLKKPNVYDKIPISLYLFYKDGIYNTFKKRAKCDIKIVQGNDKLKEYMDTHNIYSTVGIKPKNIKTNNYVPHEIHFLVPKKQDSIFVQNLIAAAISSFDFYPETATMNYKMLGTNKEHMFWKMLLGKIIFKDAFTVDKIISNMDVHLGLLNTYVDVSIKNKLKEIGVYINDFYDLIEYVVSNFHNLTINSEKRSSDISNRYIEIIYYILFDIITGINKTFFKINESFDTKKATIKDINKIFTSELTSKKIYNIVKSNGVNISVMPIDYTADNLYPKMSAILEDQNRGRGVKRSKDNVFRGYLQTIRAEDAIFGSLLYLPKKAPTPRIRFNPTIDIDLQTGKFKLEEYKGYISKVNKMLEGKLEDNELLDKIITDTDDKVEGA